MKMQGNGLKATATVAAMLVFSVGAATAQETTVVIGHAAPLTGQIAHQGKDNENGARLAVEEINAAGLVIGGKKVKLSLLAEDDAADPKTGTQVAQKFVDAKVVGVVGHLNSGVSIPASKIYSDAGIVQISPSSTNPDYTKQGFKTTYRLVATDAQQGPALATYSVNTLKSKTVAIVDDATAYGKGIADEFEKTVKKSGATVVAREATTDKATDFKAILTKIKGKKPDVIMYGGMDATAAPFTKQAAELGIKAPILAGDGACTEKVIELAGDAVKNFVCSQPGLDLPAMPKGAAFEKAFRARYNVGIQQYAPFAYDAVYVIVDAMKRANSTDPAKILAQMPTENYGGVTGNIAFDAKGDLKQSPITLYDFKNKKKSALTVIKL